MNPLLALFGLHDAGDGSLCVCDHGCTTHCRLRYQAHHDMVLDDRDEALHRGLRLPALELRPYPDRRGLPVYRIGAGRGPLVRAP